MKSKIWNVIFYPKLNKKGQQHDTKAISISLRERGCHFFFLDEMQ